MFGLSVDTLRSTRGALSQDSHIEKALIYGSRAKGNYKTGSDIDITLIGKGLTLTATIYPLRDRLHKLYLPYKFDISIFKQLDEDDFIDHISRVGKTFYQRENDAGDRWKKTTLGEVCDVIAGQSPKGSNYNDSGNGLPFYQGKKEFGDKYLGPPTKWTTQVTQEAIAGDVLMSVRAPVGPINFANERICIGRGLASIRATEQIHRDFLFYLLLSMQEEIKGKEGAVFASIAKNQIASIQFSKPPFSEQERIVAILDEAFSAIEMAIANTEKNLANARELFESVLNRVFQNPKSAGNSGDAVMEGWANLKLCEVLKLEYGKPLPKERRADNGAFPAYGANGIKCRTNDVYWEKPSIVVGRKGSAGEINLVDGGFWPLDVTYFVVFEESEYDLRFLYYLLSRLDLPSLAKGVKPGLNRNDVYAIDQYFPPLPEQKRIAATLDKASANSAALTRIGKQKLAHLANLKKSLLHQAFIGELTAAPQTADRALTEASV